jgi:hypothetical protein
MKSFLLAVLCAVLLSVLVSSPVEARLREGECSGQYRRGCGRGRRPDVASRRGTPRDGRHAERHEEGKMRLLTTHLPSFSSPAVCIKRMHEFSTAFGGMKKEDDIHNGIRKMCKTFTDKADKRFVSRTHRAESTDGSPPMTLEDLGQSAAVPQPL